MSKTAFLTLVIIGIVLAAILLFTSIWSYDKLRNAPITTTDYPAVSSAMSWVGIGTIVTVFILAVFVIIGIFAYQMK